MRQHERIYKRGKERDVCPATKRKIKYSFRKILARAIMN